MTEFNGIQIGCGCNKTATVGCCLNRVLFIFSTLAALSLGFIFGIIFSEQLIVIVPSLIAIAVILAILVVVTVIYKICIGAYSRCDDRCNL